MNTHTNVNMNASGERGAGSGGAGGGSLVVVLGVTLAVLVGVLISRAMPERGGSGGGAWGVLEGNAAFALPSDVSQTGGLTVLTSEAGNEDLLVVLDARNEELFVYRTDLKQGSQLMQRYPVGQLFMDARARSVGGQ